MYRRPTGELEALVEAVVLQERSWLYCAVYGIELALAEPDADTARCRTCNAKLKVEGPFGLGYS